MKDPDHCVLDTRASQFLCTRCKETMPLTLPVSASEFGALSRDFIRQHSECKPSFSPLSHQRQSPAR